MAFDLHAKLVSSERINDPVLTKIRNDREQSELALLIAQAARKGVEEKRNTLTNEVIQLDALIERLEARIGDWNG